MSILPLLLFILPLGLDTLGVSISLGIKSRGDTLRKESWKGLQFPDWFITAILFSVAETIMPLFGLAIGYATALAMSNISHVAGPLILIGIGTWELFEEVQEFFKKRKRSGLNTFQQKKSVEGQYHWERQLLLALSISIDELAIGFSLGTIFVSHGSMASFHPIVICILIGIQGFLMTLTGITLGRLLRTHLKRLKEWTELLSAFLLIGLGIWLLVV